MKNGVSTQASFSILSYKPFGLMYGVSGSDRIAYAGEINDTTGLIYLFARYYDPELGRLDALDPELGKLTATQTLNRYSYCGDNPISRTDPTGRFFGLNILLGAVVGAVVNTIVAVASGASLEDIAKQALIGAVSGAIAGATLGLGVSVLAGETMGSSLATATTSTVMRSIVMEQGFLGVVKVGAVNFASGAMGNIAGDFMTGIAYNKKIDPGNMIKNAFVSGALSVGSYQVLGMAGKYAPLGKYLRQPLREDCIPSTWSESWTNPSTGAIGTTTWIADPPSKGNLIGGFARGFTRAGLRAIGI